jgi:hypothetical protein
VEAGAKTGHFPSKVVDWARQSQSAKASNGNKTANKSGAAQSSVVRQGEFRGRVPWYSVLHSVYGAELIRAHMAFTGFVVDFGFQTLDFILR